MKLLRVLIPLSLISLAYNFAILLSVTLNLDWVRTRAAGGQFTDFPFAVRFVYFLMAFGMIYLMAMLWNHREIHITDKTPVLARILGYVFILSTLLQLISRSPDERWNAIPALVIALTFLNLSKERKLN